VVGEGLDVWGVEIPEVGELDEPGSDDDEQPEAVSTRSAAAAPAAARITVTPDHPLARHRPSTEAALCAQPACDLGRLATLSGDSQFLNPSLVLPIWMYLAVMTRCRTAGWDGADIHRGRRNDAHDEIPVEVGVARG
jgi:hypothetical protein